MVALSPIDPTTVCVGDEATNYCCCAGLRGVFIYLFPRARGYSYRVGYVILTGCDTMLIDQMPGRVMAVDCQLTTGQC